MRKNKLESEFSIEKEKKDFIMVDVRILENKDISLESKAYYAMIEAECIKINDIPRQYLEELVSIGYLQEVR